MRNVRFPHCLPFIYRLAGEPGWQEGQTENVSNSGVLFSAMRDLAVGVDVEMRISLSSSGYAPTVVCHVRVVRTEDRSSPPPIFAATFRDCQLIPPEDDKPSQG
jgi:hypothetical protein